MTEVNYAREYSFQLCEKPDTSQIGRLLKGAIDMHVHFDPELDLLRRYNALETALIAREKGLGGIVLKNHRCPTAILARLVQELVPDIAVLGSICLEYEVGGLNTHAVEAAARLGARVVWLPVLSAANSRKLFAKQKGIDIKGDGISILSTDGKLVPEIIDILKIVQDYNIILATGHISAREVIALADKAIQLKGVKVVATHVMNSPIMESNLKPEETQILAQKGVFIEHCAWDILPEGGRDNPENIAAAIKSEGPNNCIMSTDCGGTLFPHPAEAMRIYISAMLKCGLSEEDINYMVKLNPARLLGLA